MRMNINRAAVFITRREEIYKYCYNYLQRNYCTKNHNPLQILNYNIRLCTLVRSLECDKLSVMIKLMKRTRSLQLFFCGGSFLCVISSSLVSI